MKKLLTILLTTLMIFTLVGCNTNKEEPVILEESPIQEEIIEPTIEEEPILGGFIEAEDKSLNDELIDIFNKASEGYVGISLKPERLEATQVVAGINYKFLASGTKTTNPPIKGSYFVTIYKDLEGNCSITDIETVTESAGDVDGDAANYNYWVVFYNPDGNELQRTAQKLGTTPKYEGEEPYYWDIDYWYRFICWTDKQGNEIKEFKPITGNTYIYAKYEIGGENKPAPKESAPTPVIDPEYTQLTCLTSSTGTDAYIKTGITGSNDMKFEFKAKMNKVKCTHPFGLSRGYPNGLLFQTYEGGYEFYFGDSTGAITENVGFGTESIYEYQVKTNDIYVKINGDTLYTNINHTPVVPADEIYVFAQNSPGGITVWYDKPFTIYYFKIYQNGALVRDFIPVKTIKEIDKSKNATDSSSNIAVDTLCMYDKVTGKYYLNSGTVAFTTDPIS